MAELILTEEEKKLPSYLDWDDETLGKAVRAAMALIAHEGKDETGGTRLGLMSAAFVLIGSCVETNGSTMDITVEGATVRDKTVGDWRVRIDKLKDGELTKEIGEKVKQQNEQDGNKLTSMSLEIDNP